MSSGPVPAANVERARVFPGSTCSVAQRAYRQHQRFPITVPAEYVFGGKRFQAMTRNVSSGGVFLKTDTVLPGGEPIQVLIDWPVLLEERCHLRLVIFGKTVRSDWTGTAVEITRYEFRTRAPHPAHFCA